MAKINAVVKVDDAATKQLQAIKAEIKSLGVVAGEIKSFQALEILGQVGAALKAGLQGAWQDYSEATTEVAKLDGVLRATGGSVGITSAEFQELADSLEYTKNVSAETVLATASIASAFKNIKGDNLKEVLSLSADMSKALDKDMKSIAIAIEKAFDSDGNIDSLKKLGVSVDETTATMVESLRAQGKQTEAQALLIEELKSSYEGVATVMANNTAGAVERSGNAWGTFGEGVVKSIDPLIRLGAELSGGFAQNLAGLPGPVLAAGTAILGLAGAIPLAITGFQAMLPIMAMVRTSMSGMFGPIGWAVAAVGIIAGIASALNEPSEQLKALSVELGVTIEEAKKLESIANKTGQNTKEIAKQNKELGINAEQYANISRSVEVIATDTGKLSTGVTEVAQAYGLSEIAVLNIAKTNKSITGSMEDQVAELQKTLLMLAEQDKFSSSAERAYKNQIELNKAGAELAKKVIAIEAERREKQKKDDADEFARLVGKYTQVDQIKIVEAEIARLKAAGPKTYAKQIKAAEDELKKLKESKAEIEAKAKAQDELTKKEIAWRKLHDREDEVLSPEPLDLSKFDKYKDQETPLQILARDIAEMKQLAAKAGEDDLPKLQKAIANAEKEADKLKFQGFISGLQTAMSNIQQFGGALLNVFAMQDRLEADQAARQTKALEDQLAGRQKYWTEVIKAEEQAGRVTADLMRERDQELAANEKTIQDSKNAAGKKAFEANKGNQIAQAVMSGASAMLQTFSQFGYPFGIIPAGIMGALTAAQVGLMNQQQYTPAFASGGIVYPTGDTRGVNVRVAEYETEYILRQSQLDKIRGQGQSSTTVLNVTIQGVIGNENQVYAAVYNGIESLRKDGKI